MKIAQRDLAIKLRRDGRSYSEILKKVPVAKSTLSLWLRSVNLVKPQKQALTQKRIEAALRGARKRKTQRLELSEKIKKEAVKEIGKIDKKVFWLMGAALYWAEGAKQKEHQVSTGVIFSNSDPMMVRFFYKWLMLVCGENKESIYFEIYLHRGCDVEEIKRFWAKLLGMQVEEFSKIRYKPSKFYSYRKNKGKDYHGLIRINVRKSTNLNRKIIGWAEGACLQFLA